MSKPHRPNQTVIAKMTGVSRATVSLVLRGGKGASQETEAKVLGAARSIGYRPNALVHSIRSGKSRTIGVLAHPHDSFWRDVCYGIHDRLIEADHLPLFLWCPDRVDRSNDNYALRQINRLLDRWIDGVILWPYFAELYSQHLKEFRTRNIPVVTIDQMLPDIRADYVGTDENQLANSIVTHLTKLGHRNVLVASGPRGLGWADERFDALQAEFSKLPECKIHELRIPMNPTTTQEAAKAIFSTLNNKPEITAVIACTDEIAKGAYAAAEEAGLEIPTRLSVIGVSDADYAPVMKPPLTTVRQDAYAIGRCAAQVALERSTGELAGAPNSYRHPAHLIERSSTARVFV